MESWELLTEKKPYWADKQHLNAALEEHRSSFTEEDGKKMIKLAQDYSNNFFKQYHRWKNPKKKEQFSWDLTMSKNPALSEGD